MAGSFDDGFANNATNTTRPINVQRKNNHLLTLFLVSRGNILSTLFLSINVLLLEFVVAVILILSLKRFEIHCESRFISKVKMNKVKPTADTVVDIRTKWCITSCDFYNVSSHGLN